METTAEPDRTGQPHIFVVNGSPDLLDIIGELLRGEQYRVTVTNFLPKTFKQIETLQPALLIIDLAVGARGGWDLLRRLRAAAATQGIPVLITSTDSHLLDRAQMDFATYGGQAFLSYPMDVEDLLADIRSLTGA
jgi:DNA-binding response OmpR family regulator